MAPIARGHLKVALSLASQTDIGNRIAIANAIPKCQLCFPLPRSSDRVSPGSESALQTQAPEILLIVAC